MTRPETYRHIHRVILADQRSNLTTFMDEWTTALEKDSEAFPWMVKIDGPVRVLAEAYSQELERLTRGKAGSREWTEILEHAKLLRAATFDRLQKVQPLLNTSLPISGPDPKGIADKTYEFLVDAAYQFGSSLGKLRKDFPANVQIVAG
jgi:hypothetical protein